MISERRIPGLPSGYHCFDPMHRSQSVATEVENTALFLAKEGDEIPPTYQREAVLRDPVHPDCSKGPSWRSGRMGHPPGILLRIVAEKVGMS